MFIYMYFIKKISPVIYQVVWTIKIKDACRKILQPLINPVVIHAVLVNKAIRHQLMPFLKSQEYSEKSRNAIIKTVYNEDCLGAIYMLSGFYQTLQFLRHCSLQHDYSVTNQTTIAMQYQSTECVISRNIFST